MFYRFTYAIKKLIDVTCRYIGHNREMYFIIIITETVFLSIFLMFKLQPGYEKGKKGHFGLHSSNPHSPFNLDLINIFKLILQIRKQFSFYKL